MFTKIRNRVERDEGFTLIELLVVILIIGILAAIAIPSFLNQREKGQDACAKSMARTMQTAEETWYIDNNTYVGGDETATGLPSIENQITGGKCGSATVIKAGLAQAAGSSTGGGGCSGTVGGTTGSGYCVSATSSATSGGTHTFSIARAETTGAITRTCGPIGKGGCIAAGTW